MTRRTLTYVVILVVLAGLSLLRLTLPQGPAPIAFKIPAFKPEEVDKLVITSVAKKPAGAEQTAAPASTEPQSVTIERGDATGKVWNVTAPFKYPADGGVIESILKAFENETTMDLLVSSDPKEHASYELLPDQAVKLEIYRKGQLETALYIGKNATGGASYIRPVNSEEVYRAKTVTKARLDKPAADWRDKKLFDVKKEDITKLEILNEGVTWAFKSEGGKWKAEQPADLQVDQSTLDGMARAFSNLRVADILDSAPGDTGLTTPSMKISATLASGVKTILVGGEKEPGTRYVMREGDSQLFTVRDGSLSLFRKGRNDLRDKSLFDFDAEAMTYLKVSRGEKKLALEKVTENGQQGWKPMEQVGVTLDPKGLQSAMAAVTTLRVANYLETADGADFKSNPLVIELKAGDKAHTITVGNDKGNGELYATRTPDGAVFTLREFALNPFKQILGEAVAQPPQRPGMGGLPPGMQLPPGVQLPPGMAMP